MGQIRVRTRVKRKKSETWKSCGLNGLYRIERKGTWETCEDEMKKKKVESRGRI